MYRPVLSTTNLTVSGKVMELARVRSEAKKVRVTRSPIRAANRDLRKFSI